MEDSELRPSRVAVAAGFFNVLIRFGRKMLVEFVDAPLVFL